MGSWYLLSAAEAAAAQQGAARAQFRGPPLPICPSPTLVKGLSDSYDKEEPQLPTTRYPQDNKEPSLGSSTEYGQQPFDIPDSAPPPYSNPASGSTLVSGVGLADVPTLKTIRVQKHHGSISGTYIIDPDVSGDDPSILQGFAAKLSDRGKGKDSAAPHAVFCNRFGSIFLTLVIKGSSERCHRAIVDVSTRYGDINVNLSSVHPGKRITLNVTSHRGLSSSIRSMNGKRRKTLLLIGDSAPTSGSTDHCRLSSHHGKIVLGVSGRDSMPQREDSIWRKIGSFFRGGESS
ncbi:uncharacterized protein EDB91DRAFT_103490 [Suillus paluster]|uniref:uncharacterized protein n=1 Tax=Suillus paluster TaxID=48578 RepID=UPI001B860BD2|nr:uncharacterized protein EDB91DRAFT_103490 [Suillus paluster]KAG1746605.1 hypothetical protein EDB91DRAFT_103490 [Suillus paluster]